MGGDYQKAGKEKGKELVVINVDETHQTVLAEDRGKCFENVKTFHLNRFKIKCLMLKCNAS